VTSPVAGVQFLLDGNPLGAEDTTSPYSVSWNSATAANGLHVLSARSRDTVGNTATSVGVSVDVGNDAIAPAVAITSPGNGGIVTGSNVTVSANASDNVGVVGVQFLLDGSPLGVEVSTAPYTTRWNTNSRGKGGSNAGSHTLSARARDAAGNVTTSAIVRVIAQ
jgi:Bacterial Ig domain